MIMLKKYLLKRKLRALLNQRNLNKAAEYIPLEKDKSVVIYMDKSACSKLEAEIKALRKRVKSVSCIIYTVDKNDSDTSDTVFLAVEKDFTKLGLPTTQTLEKIQKIETDILIDLTDRTAYSMKYLFANHPARMKVGAKDDAYDLYNFSIAISDDKSDSSFLFKQIIYYLDTIHS